MPSGSVFDDVTIEQLRRRRSEKWSTYPPDVLPAFVAEMDFPLAPAVRAALQEALDASDCGYAGTQGLGSAFARFAQTRWGWELGAERVIPVPDVMAGISQALLTFTAPGDGVVINPPVYPPFFEVIQTIGRSILEVPLLHDEVSLSWSLDFAGLQRAFASGARAYVLCHPH